MWLVSSVCVWLLSLWPVRNFELLTEAGFGFFLPELI